MMIVAKIPAIDTDIAKSGIWPPVELIRWGTCLFPGRNIADFTSQLNTRFNILPHCIRVKWVSQRKRPLIAAFLQIPYGKNMANHLRVFRILKSGFRFSVIIKGQ